MNIDEGDGERRPRRGRGQTDGQIEDATRKLHALISCHIETPRRVLSLFSTVPPTSAFPSLLLNTVLAHSRTSISLLHLSIHFYTINHARIPFPHEFANTPRHVPPRQGEQNAPYVLRIARSMVSEQQIPQCDEPTTPEASHQRVEGGPSQVDSQDTTLSLPPHDNREATREHTRARRSPG